MATNLWERFKEILPESPLTIVTVKSINTANGTSMVETVGGGAMRVMGTSVAVNKKAYVRDMAIVEEAPNVPHYEITV